MNPIQQQYEDLLFKVREQILQARKQKLTRFFRFPAILHNIYYAAYSYEDI